MKPVLTLALIATLIIGLNGCAGGDKQSQTTTIRQRIAQSYGFEYFGQIEQIQYTFNVRIGDKHARRFWIWEPKLDKVTFDGMDYKDPITYYRKDLQTNPSTKLKSIDAWFINDNYWFFVSLSRCHGHSNQARRCGPEKTAHGQGGCCLRGGHLSGRRRLHTRRCL